MLYLIYGPDIFRARQHINKIIASEQANMNQCHFIDSDNISVSELSTLLEPLQLFSQKQLLILKNPAGNKQKTVITKLTQSLNSLSPNLELIIWEQNNIDKRSALYKKCRQLAQITEFNLLKTAELMGWLKKYCLDNNINIHHQALVKLITRNTDTFALINELTKLKIYSDNNIQPDIVEQLTPTNPQEIIFDLTDQISTRNQKSYQTARQLISKGEDQTKLISTLATHINNLIVIKEALVKNANLNELQKITGLHPFVIKKSVPQTKNFSFPQLLSIYSSIARADINLKSNQSDFSQEIYKIIKLAAN